MAREKHLGETVMYRIALVGHFCMENRLSKIIFLNPFPKKRRSGESQKSGFRFDPKYPPRVWPDTLDS